MSTSLNKFSVFIILFFGLTVSQITSFASNVLSEEEYSPFAEVMPQPVGGIESIYKMVKYPLMAQKAGIEGKVYVMAYINESGMVDDAKVIKGIGAGCDEAALDAVKKSKFTVATNKDNPVKVKMSLQIIFKLK